MKRHRLRVNRLRTAKLACVATGLSVLSAATLADDLGSADVSQSREAQLQQYELRLEDALGAHSAYSPALAEVLSGLGNAQQELGRHADALRSFDQSLHVMRINNGLYSPQSLPILERMAQSHAELGDWESVDQRHHLITEVSARSYGAADARMVDILQRKGQWHMFAYMNSLAGAESWVHLQSAMRTYQHAAAVAEKNFGPADPRVVTSLRGLRDAQYFLNLMRMEEVADYNRSQQFQSSRSSDTFIDRPRLRAGNVSFNTGLRTAQRIERAVSEDESASLADKAAALAELGDWFQSFQKRRTAAEHYAKAWALLGGEEHAELRAKMFAKPTAISYNGDYEDYLAASTDAGVAEGYVLFNIAVSRHGTLKGAEFVEAQPQSSEQRRKAMRGLRKARFRPALEGGVPVATDSVPYRWVYLYPAAPSQPAPTQPATNTNPPIVEES